MGFGKFFQKFGGFIQDVATGGAYSQRQALGRATQATQEAENRRWALVEQLMAEGKPLRQAFAEASLAALGPLREDILREPGTGPLFTTGLRRGTQAIMQALAPYGLTESSVTGRAIGDLSEGLLARDIESIREARFRLAGFAPETLPAAVSFASQAGGLTETRAGLLAQSPYSQFYRDLQQGLIQAGGFLFGGGGKGSPSPSFPQGPTSYPSPYEVNYPR